MLKRLRRSTSMRAAQAPPARSVARDEALSTKAGHSPRDHAPVRESRIGSDECTWSAHLRRWTRLQPPLLSRHPRGLDAVRDAELADRRRQIVADGPLRQ